MPFTPPTTGEQIVQITIDRDGTMSFGTSMTVLDRSRYSILQQEFVTDAGSRYDAKHLFPEGSAAGGIAPVSHFPVSMFIYARAADVPAASGALTVAFLSAHQEALEDAAKITKAIQAAIATALS